MLYHVWRVVCMRIWDNPWWHNNLVLVDFLSWIHVEITRIFSLQKEKISSVIHHAIENKSYKSAKLLGYFPRPADLTDTGQLQIASRHYGFKSTETCNSTASSRWWRRQQFLCNSQSSYPSSPSLPWYVLYIKLYQLLTQYINILPPPLLFFIAIFINYHHILSHWFNLFQ